MKDLRNLVRPNIQALERLSTNRTDDVRQRVMLDRCENPFNSPENRYPGTSDEQRLKTAIANDRRIKPEGVTLTMGDSGALDLILRTFCTPQRDNVVIPDPTLPSYATVAAINDVECRRVRLTSQQDISARDLLNAANQHTKAIILCSPNYPTGRLFNRQQILQLAERFEGLVVIDESYADFSRSASMVSELASHQNLVVIRNFSTSFACAGICLSYIMASEGITHFLNAANRHTAIPSHVISEGIEMMTRRRFDVDKWVKWILDERTKVISAISVLPFCKEVFPSDANFFLARVDNAQALKAYLAESGISVADCCKFSGYEDCLNITIGLTADNNALLGALRKY